MTLFIMPSIYYIFNNRRLKKAAKKAEQELDEKALNEAKDEISSKITETLGATLANSKFKEALKGMNIKINISFEDK